MRFGTATNTAARPTSTTDSTTRPANAGRKKATVYTTEENEGPRCPLCDGAHTLAKCRQYLALSVSKRWEVVREKGFCFRCIDSKHRRYMCRAKMCGVGQCRRPHHSALHEENEGARSAPAA